MDLITLLILAYLLSQVAIVMAAASRNRFGGATALGMVVGFVLFMLFAGSVWFAAALTS